ncbi:MAG: hypothetical protein IKS28_06005 [Clostridia bacterium]|nr:hypothetical protein [Clostridia bacterium]
MKEEKAIELKKNELDDSELDQVAGGADFHVVSTDNLCFFCRAPIDLRADHWVLRINGETQQLCNDCGKNYVNNPSKGT